MQICFITLLSNYISTVRQMSIRITDAWESVVRSEAAVHEDRERYEPYLHWAAGDGAGDAVLVGDVVGTVVGWARTWPRGAVTGRFWKINNKRSHCYGESETAQYWCCLYSNASRVGCTDRPFLVSELCADNTLTCHVQRALLGCGNGTILPPQQWAAPPLRHLLLQPGAQLQVRLRRCGQRQANNYVKSILTACIDNTNGTRIKYIRTQAKICQKISTINYDYFRKYPDSLPP